MLNTISNFGRLPSILQSIRIHEGIAASVDYVQSIKFSSYQLMNSSKLNKSLLLEQRYEIYPRLPAQHKDSYATCISGSPNFKEPELVA